MLLLQKKVFAPPPKKTKKKIVPCPTRGPSSSSRSRNSSQYVQTGSFPFWARWGLIWEDYFFSWNQKPIKKTWKNTGHTGGGHTGHDGKYKAKLDLG